MNLALFFRRIPPRNGRESSAHFEPSEPPPRPPCARSDPRRALPCHHCPRRHRHPDLPAENSNFPPLASCAHFALASILSRGFVLRAPKKRPPDLRTRARMTSLGEMAQTGIVVSAGTGPWGPQGPPRPHRKPFPASGQFPFPFESLAFRFQQISPFGTKTKAVFGALSSPPTLCCRPLPTNNDDVVPRYCSRWTCSRRRRRRR